MLVLPRVCVYVPLCCCQCVDIVDGVVVGVVAMLCWLALMVGSCLLVFLTNC